MYKYIFRLAIKMFRSFSRSARILSSSRRSFSSSASDQLVHLSVDSGVATVTMQNGPVNALSLEMCQALSSAIRTAEAESSTQALILQSASPTIFSSGLDIMEMHKPNSDRLVEFWRSFQDLYFALYGSRLACIAAIEGHAPAAGCMLALSCDYRIMGEKGGKIGLNESQLGIVAPPWLGQQMIDTVGRRETEKALALGTLYAPSEALAIQLVDEVVDQQQVREAAVRAASQWAKIPPPARVASKLLLRKVRLDKLQDERDSDIQHFVGFITNETTQRNISGYLKMLAAKKQQK